MGGGGGDNGLCVCSAYIYKKVHQKLWEGAPVVPLPGSATVRL